ncbi:two-component sensor histidine kinase [Flavobacterium cheongpyeongense]|uniref:histidine kinase n=1 Tax=Flavobacterium cheongpyeongense TaxID=2212651 RepID=A0A2V4BPQ4_9FLAO|nr:ATP-binding protein [Flavobacterium cheongpyeongense]PXY40959.1 two-component sensor histidine kinase [Flavobacterium cheongpyeongense]
MLAFRNFITLFWIFLFSIPVIGQKKSFTEKELTKLYNEATANLHKENYEKSLIQSRQLLNHSLLLQNHNLIGKAYNTIAANFDGISEPEKALFYYKKSLIYAEKSNNLELQNWLYNNIGNIYCFDKKKYEKGISYYIKSLYYSRATNDSAQVFFTKLNIAWAYFDIGRFSEGYPYLKYINKYNHKYGIETTVAVTDMLNGMYYTYKNNKQKADYSFKKGIKNAIKYDEKSDLCYIYQEYSKFLSKNKNFEAAYKTLYLFQLLNDEINLEDKAKKAKIAGINLEIDEYKREIDKMGIESKRREKLFHSESARKNKMTTIILSLFLISLILFYFFYQNTKLKQKNRIKDIQNKIHQNIINASIDGQESERKKVALFLHDTISASLSSAGMHLNVFLAQHDSLSDEITKTKLILDETHDKVRDLSHDLIPSLLARFGLLYALDDLCEKYSNSTLHFEYQNTIPIKKRYTEKFETRLYFIISELLNNIIKHSEASRAEVSLIENNNEMIIEITDNGKGFDTNKFNFVEGFGLNQIKARINNLNGKFDVRSKINEGTSVLINVPLNV